MILMDMTLISALLNSYNSREPRSNMKRRWNKGGSAIATCGIPKCNIKIWRGGVARWGVKFWRHLPRPDGVVGCGIRALVVTRCGVKMNVTTHGRHRQMGDLVQNKLILILIYILHFSFRIILFIYIYIFHMNFNFFKSMNNFS